MERRSIQTRHSIAGNHWTKWWYRAKSFLEQFTEWVDQSKHIWTWEQQYFPPIKEIKYVSIMKRYAVESQYTYGERLNWWQDTQAEPIFTLLEMSSILKILLQTVANCLNFLVALYVCGSDLKKHRIVCHCSIWNAYINKESDVSSTQDASFWAKSIELTINPKRLMINTLRNWNQNWHLQCYLYSTS